MIRTATFVRPIFIAVVLSLCAIAPATVVGQSQGAGQNQEQRKRPEEPKPPGPPEVRELRFEGLHAFSEGDIRKALVTQQSSCNTLLVKPVCAIGVKSSLVYTRHVLDEQEFQRDVIRLLVFYFRRGYRDTRVDTSTVSVGDNQVRITMAVTEGPPTVVNQVTVTGIEEALSRRDTTRNVRPAVGDPLNLLALDSSVTRLRDRLWDRGYADAVLKLTTAVDDSARRAQTAIAVTPNAPVTIGAITVEGNERIDKQTILNSLLIQPGDLFRLARISSSQRALYESALFRRAVIDTTPRGSAEADSVKGLVVRVVEGPQREARTSFGFTTADFVQAEAAFTHNYLMHQPLRLDASVTVGNLLAEQLTKSDFFANISDIVQDDDLGRYYAPTYQANVDFTRRWFGSPRNTVSAGVFLHRRSSPGVLIDRGYGASATFTRMLANRMPLSVRYQFEQSRVEAGDVYFCVNYGVCDNATISALRGRQRLSPLAFTFSIDRTDIPFSPTRGILARAEFENAAAYTGSDFRYNRGFVDIAAYRKIGFRQSVFAAHLKAGYVNPLASTSSAVGDGRSISGNLQILHPRKRFYAGGSQSVRGFGENQLGPRVLTVPAATLKRGAIVGNDTIPCAPTAPSAECLMALKDNDFQTRPLGGTTLLEGSVELRVPLPYSLVAAFFVDGAILGNGSVTTITSGKGAITPGFGIRYKSPVGPIRIDLGIRPNLKSVLPVITEVRDAEGKRRLVDLTGGAGCTSRESMGCRIYPGPLAKQSFVNRLTNRLTLHLSIGEAY